MIVQSKAPVEVQEHVVLYDVGWDAYEAILSAMGSRRLRHTYDLGTLEIMSPLKRHDRRKKLLARLIETAALELDIEIQSIGSTTLRRRAKEKGLEPDECYYVAHEAQVRFEEDYVPERDPPPDLAIEVDVTNSSLSRMPVYVGLGVPEVWRLGDDSLQFFRLEGQKYAPLNRSLAFPPLTPPDLARFMDLRSTTPENAVIRAFVAWLRSSHAQ